MSGFNLDAILAETEPKPLTYKGQTFMLPGELPGAVLAPFLRDDLGLIDLVAEAFSDLDDDDEDTTVIDLVFDALKARPALPVELIRAAGDSLKALLGDDFDAFQALRPSVPAYLAIAKGIVTEYGASLTDFFDSGESSESDGTSSKATSPSTTTDSTPASSGKTPAKKARKARSE